jgi:hypothetical protein
MFSKYLLSSWLNLLEYSTGLGRKRGFRTVDWQPLNLNDTSWLCQYTLFNVDPETRPVADLGWRA